MASYIQGYDEERFATTVNRNFLCSICFNVLKDPVLCSRNQHCFCRSCITKHLKNARRCPTCADKLTVETLAEPNRMVKDYLNELKIHCIYIDRGCQEILQLQQLDKHEATCGFTPAVCSNQGCGATLNQRDLVHHQSELCEFRKLKCHSCGEMTKMLADIEKRIANVEKNMAKNDTMEKKIASVEKNVEKNMERNTADMEGKLEVINNEVRGLKTALIQSFDEMKDVLVKMEDKMEENARKVRNTPSGDNENIIVAGGFRTDSVEKFNWQQRTWSPLESLPMKRWGGTSFVYNNQVTFAGGYCSGSINDDMITMNINPNPDLSIHWSDCPVELPTKLTGHSSVLYNDHLMVTGGYNLDGVSDSVHEVQLVYPYAVKTLSRMPQPRRHHRAQLFDDNLLIVGGTTNRYDDSLSSVVLYDIKKEECKELAPLPYEVSQMATVRWGDNVVVIGGYDRHGKKLDKVVIYNLETEQSHLLPSMKCKRQGCAAVVIGNSIVVLGGWDEHYNILKSVEAFDFGSYSWQELPEMSQGRTWHTAVVV